jgi:hypothetical protein
MAYGKVLYDLSNSKKANKRKMKAKFEYKKIRRYYIILGAFFAILVTFSLQNPEYAGAPLMLMIVFGILGYSFTFLFIPFVIHLTKKGFLYKSLDLKIYESGFILPDWSSNPQIQTKYYQKDLIEKIYWNEGSDHLLIIKTNKGLELTRSKYKHKMIYKNIIDDKEAFKKALRITSKLIEDQRMEIQDWLKQKKITSILL